MQSIWSSLLLQVDIPIFTEDHKVHRTAEHLFLLFSRILHCFSWFRFYLLMFQSAAATESCSEVEMTLLISLTPTRTLTCQRTTPEMYQVMKTLLNLVSVLSQLSTSDVLSTWPTPPTPEIFSAESNDRMNKINKFNVNFRWCLAKTSNISKLFSNHPSLQVLKARQPSWPAQWRAELTEWSPGSGGTCTLSSSAAETSSSHQTPGSVSPTPRALRTGCWALPRPGWLTVVTTSARSTLSPRSTWASDSMFYVSYLLSRRL